MTEEVRRFRQQRGNGKHGQRLAWRDDPVILERLSVELPYIARGWTHPRILVVVNEWCVEHGYPQISLTTIRDDHKRLVEKKRDDLEEIRNEQLLTLKHIRATAFEDHEEEVPGSSERSSLLTVAERAVQDEAKITGTMVHIVKKEVTVTDDSISRMLFAVLVEMIGEAQADRVVDELQRRLAPSDDEDVKLIAAKVVNADN